MMDPEQQSKFAIHEAAREGRSMPHYTVLILATWLTITKAAAVESLINVIVLLRRTNTQTNHCRQIPSLQQNEMMTSGFLYIGPFPTITCL